MTPRLWDVVLQLHADDLASVQIHVDARLLLPSCERRRAAQALGYIEAVLVDSRPEDQLALRLQRCDGSPQYRRTHDSRDAISWLRKGANQPPDAASAWLTAPGGGEDPRARNSEGAPPPSTRPFKAGS